MTLSTDDTPDETTSARNHTVGTRRSPKPWLPDVLAVGLASALVLTGCRQILGLEDGRLVADGGDGDDGGVAPDDCDGDEDGFFHPHPSCDSERGEALADCDDTRDDVFPGAPVVCGDGAENNCAGLGTSVASLGIAEAGLVRQHTLFITDPAGFVNNASIAAERDVVYMGLSVSALQAVFLRSDYDVESPTPFTRPALFPGGYNFANSEVGVVDNLDGSFRFATVGLNSGNGPEAVVADVTNVTNAVGLQVPMSIEVTCETFGDDRVQVSLGALGNGALFYEVTNTATSEQKPYLGFRVGAVHRIACGAPLDTIGIPFNEFGSNIVASGNMVFGVSNSQAWTLKSDTGFGAQPFAYSTSTIVAGRRAVLARDVSGGTPVLFAYESGFGANGAVTVEGARCQGLAGCTRTSANTIAKPGFDAVSAGDLSLTSVGTGAALLATKQADETTTLVELRFVDADGSPLGGPVLLGAVGDEPTTDVFRSMESAIIPPDVGAPFYELLTSVVIDRSAQNQHSVRLDHARLCENL